MTERPQHPGGIPDTALADHVEEGPHAYLNPYPEAGGQVRFHVYNRGFASQGQFLGTPEQAHGHALVLRLMGYTIPQEDLLWLRRAKEWNATHSGKERVP